MASGALMTGDQHSGYTLHLRPPDGSSHGSQSLRRFMEIVNGSRVLAPAGQPQQPQSQPSTQPSTPQRPGASTGPCESGTRQLSAYTTCTKAFGKLLTLFEPFLQDLTMIPAAGNFADCDEPAGPSRQPSRGEHPPLHHHTASDEELARQLQEQYDAEYGGNGRPKQPPSPIRVSQVASLF